MLALSLSLVEGAILMHVEHSELENRVTDDCFRLFGEHTATDEVDPETFRAHWWPARIESLTRSDGDSEQSDALAAAQEAETYL
jgi:hypothetical protein